VSIMWARLACAGLRAALAASRDGSEPTDAQEDATARRLLIRAIVPTAPFETIYRAHSKVVGRMARRRGVSPSDLDDAVQDIFLILYRRWAECAKDEELDAWLRGVATRTSWNYRRARRRRERWLEAQPDIVDVYADPLSLSDEHVASWEEQRWLTQALLGLDERKRQAVVLTQLEQKSAKEVSRLTGLSPNTVASRLRIALAELRKNGKSRAKRERAQP
jgi:RNA polymerase sigma factor (sigma-70 family)